MLLSFIVFLKVSCFPNVFSHDIMNWELKCFLEFKVEISCVLEIPYKFLVVGKMMRCKF